MTSLWASGQALVIVTIVELLPPTILRAVCPLVPLIPLNPTRKVPSLFSFEG